MPPDPLLEFRMLRESLVGRFPRSLDRDHAAALVVNAARERGILKLNHRHARLRALLAGMVDHDHRDALEDNLSTNQPGTQGLHET